jgi:hypothetical protein
VEHKNPFDTFDWYFTDASPRNSARVDALEAKPAETAILQDLVSADSIVHFALWSVLPKNHPVAELWMEPQTDLQASIYLAYGGFFRQALTVLRAWFEIAVHGVFFSAHYGQPTARYEQWRKGHRNASAKMKELSEALALRRDRLIPVDLATIYGKINPPYAFLSPTMCPDICPRVTTFGSRKCSQPLMQSASYTGFSFQSEWLRISSNQSRSKTMHENSQGHFQEKCLNFIP